MLAEKADGEVTFQSVFDPTKVTKTTGPRLPGGPPIKEPRPREGQGIRGRAGQGRAAGAEVQPAGQLAAQLATPDNTQFRRNIANRLWALMMGRGLVHPLDLDHTANPPSHPELLDLLADELAAHEVRRRAMLLRSWP